MLSQESDRPHHFGRGRLVRVDDSMRVSPSVVFEVLWDLSLSLPYCGILRHNRIQLRLGEAQDAAYGVEATDIGAGNEVVLYLLDDGLA